MPGENNQGRIVQNDRQQDMNKGNKQDVSKGNFDKAVKESEKLRTKKPGSQSNSSKRHNNGRGGGK